MKLIVMVFALVFVAGTAHAASSKNANLEIDCSLVRIDAQSGAEKARAGILLDKALLELENSYRELDAQLIKAKHKPTNLAVKTQAKMSFTDGYHQALREPHEQSNKSQGKQRTPAWLQSISSV